MVNTNTRAVGEELNQSQNLGVFEKWKDILAAE